MSCPEVVYQAYYPYLYQRPGPSTSRAPPPPPPPPHFYHHPHYDRVTQALSGGGGVTPVSGRASEDSCNEAASPSVSSYSRQPSLTPPSPPHRSVYTSEDEDSSGQSSSRAQYVSANCVVFTHYTGDVAAVVDEHFNRALAAHESKQGHSSKDWSPMSSRNFPPSFWNSNSTASSSSSSGSGGPSGGEPGCSHSSDVMYPSTSAEPWHSHYQQYHHHRAVQEYHQGVQAAAAMQYAGGGLLLPAHQYKEPSTSWHPQHRLHDPTPHHLDPGAYYPAISGLEPQSQESTSKDLYWF